MSEQNLVVAFYGLSKVEGLAKTFHHDILHWFGEQGCSADYMAVGTAVRRRKLLSFKSAEAKLLKNGFDDVEDISIYSTPPDFESLERDCKLSASYSIKRDVLVISAQSSLSGLDRGHLFGVASKMINAVQPGYGIGYTRDKALGPTLYAVGLSQGLGWSGDGDLEALNISFWNEGRYEKIWEIGLLRDVYEWNFLNQTQLERSVDGMALQSWIQSDAVRGTLTPISGDIMLWELDSANIPAVRRAIWKAGLIFDWTRDLEGVETHPSVSASRAWAAARAG